jgi:WD40 repeat protein
LPDAPDENRTALWEPAGEAVLTYYASPDPEIPEQQDGTLWDAGTQDVIARVPGPIWKAYWQPGMLLVSGEEGQARFVDPATGMATPLEGQSASVNDAQIHGDWVALADQKGQVGVWERTSGVQRWIRNEGGAVWVDRVQWRSDGTRLASAQNNGIVVWDAASGQPVWTWLEGAATAVAFGPDERYLAAAITIEGVSGLAVFDLEGNEAGPWIYLFSRNAVMGVQWLTGRDWDNQDFHRPFFNFLPRWLTGAPSAEDGTRRLLLTWDNDGSIRLWDVGREEEVWRAEEGADLPVNSAAASPDSAHIGSVGMSGVVRVWSAPTLAPSTWPQIITRERVLTRELTEQQRVLFGLADTGLAGAETEKGRSSP